MKENICSKKFASTGSWRKTVRLLLLLQEKFLLCMSLRVFMFVEQVTGIEPVS